MKMKFLAGVAALTTIALPAKAEISTPNYIQGQWCYVGPLSDPVGSKEFRRGPCDDNYMTFTRYIRLSKWGATSNECQVIKVDAIRQSWMISLKCDGDYKVEYQVWKSGNNNLAMIVVKSDDPPPKVAVRVPTFKPGALDLPPVPKAVDYCISANPPADDMRLPGLLNIRERPDLKSEILLKVSAGTTMKAVSEFQDWINIEKGGWVARKYINVVACTPDTRKEPIDWSERQTPFQEYQSPSECPKWLGVKCD
jgi:hypothetical protein